MDLVDTNNLTITLSGDADLTITPTLGVQYDLFSGLQSVTASADVDLSGNVDLSLSFGVSTNVEVLLAEIQGAPIPIAPLVVAVPTLLLYGGASAGVDASIDNSATVDANYLVGATWQKGLGWSNLSSQSVTFASSPLRPTVSGSLRGYVRPEILFDIDDVAGPDLYAEGGVTLAASADLATNQFCWSLTGDLDAGVGITLDVFGFALASYNAQIFSVSTQFLGNCYSLGPAL